MCGCADSPEGCSWSVFLRNLHAGFHSGCSSFRSCQPASRPLQHLSLAFGFHLLRQALKMDPRWAQDSWQPPYHSLICFLDDSHSDWVSENLSVVLTCISLLTKDVANFFQVLLAVCISLRTTYPVHIPLLDLGFWHLTFAVFNIIVINHFSDLQLENTFLSSTDCRAISHKFIHNSWSPLQKVLIYASPGSFMSCTRVHFDLVLSRGERRIYFHSFTCAYSVYPLWISALTIIPWPEKLLWWDPRVALIYGCLVQCLLAK